MAEPKVTPEMIDERWAPVGDFGDHAIRTVLADLCNTLISKEDARKMHESLVYTPNSLDSIRDGRVRIFHEQLRRVYGNNILAGTKGK